MTCIAAIVQNGKSYIAGERGASTDSSIFQIAEPKVWKTGEYLFGYYGTFMGERLKFNFQPPKMTKNTDLVTFMNSTFLQALHQCYQDWWIEKHEDTELIVVVRGKIFVHNAQDMSMTMYDTDFLAEGSGAEYAVGSLYSTNKLGMNPEERLQIAMQSAITFSPTCVGPIDIVTSED